jgi:hypothetical protein
MVKKWEQLGQKNVLPKNDMDECDKGEEMSLMEYLLRNSNTDVSQ